MLQLPRDLKTLMLIEPRDNEDYCRQHGLFVVMRIGPHEQTFTQWTMIISERVLVTIMVILGQSQQSIQKETDCLSLNPRHLLHEMDRLPIDWFEAVHAPLNDRTVEEAVEMIPVKGSNWGKTVNCANGTGRSMKAMRRYLTMLRMLAIECERREIDLIVRHLSQEVY
jgi:hypothetical protein